VYEALNWTVPNWIALNTTMQSQNKACITKSCKVFALLRYYAAQSDNSALTFWDNLSVPDSRVKKSKRENRAREFIGTIFFGGHFPSSIFLKTQNVSEVGSISVFRESST
jgi:hypothetical protein